MAIQAIAGDHGPWQRRMIGGLIEAGVRVTGVSLKDRDFYQEIVRQGRPNLLHFRKVDQLAEQGRGWFRSRVGTAGAIQQLQNLQSQGTRLIWTFDQLDPPRRRGMTTVYQLRLALAEIADRIVVEHESIISQIERTYHVAIADRAVVIPAAVDEADYESQGITAAEARQALGIPLEANVFAMVDTLSVRHGIGTAIEAFRSLSSSAVWLILAGEQRLSDREKKWVDERRRDQPRMIYHPGWVESEAVQVYLKACDCSLIPGRGNVDGGAVRRSIWMGRPILAPSGSLAAVLGDLPERCLFDQVSMGLAAGMEAMISMSDADRTALLEHVAGCRRRMEERGWAEVIAETVGMYENCL